MEVVCRRSRRVVKGGGRFEGTHVGRSDLRHICQYYAIPCEKRSLTFGGTRVDTMVAVSVVGGLMLAEIKREAHGAAASRLGMVK